MEPSVLAGGGIVAILLTALLTLMRLVVVRADREVERWRKFAELADNRADTALDVSREMLTALRSVEELVREHRRPDPPYAHSTEAA